MAVLEVHGVIEGRDERSGRKPGAVALGLGAACALAGCGRDASPPWIDLARGFAPPPLTAQVERWEREAGTPTGNAVTNLDDGIELRHDVAPDVASDAWRREEPGTFSVALPGGAFTAAGIRPRFIAPGAEFPWGAPDRELAVNEVRFERGRLTLRIPVVTHRPPKMVARHYREGSDTPEEYVLPPTYWKKAEGAGLYWVPLPLNMVLTGEHAPKLFAELAEVGGAEPLGPYEFRFEGERLRLQLPEDEPPRRASFVARLGIGASVDGAWRLRLGHVAGEGIPVWSGDAAERVCDVPRESVLRFAFVYANSAGAPATARVRLDGTVVFEQTHADPREPLHVRIPLPPEGRRAARLAFEVSGPPGLGAFFVPVIGPLAPPVDARPDLVLFIADTLRADALALYGGDPAHAPRLNRFAEQALRFPRARSNAAWTLPSISTILTGVYPGQHGATDENLVLPGGATTLAERLAAAGWRTGAITDGSFFSWTFGMEQGFEWFSQTETPEWDLDRTLADARAFLERGDGRPTFLVVHTYRVHQPYRVGPDEDSTAYDALIQRAQFAAGTVSPGRTKGNEIAMQYRDELRSLYVGGVRDLDAKFGGFLDWLEGRRFFEHGALVFTADHGEALGENGDFFHSGHLWEVKLRVPLLVRAPGIESRDVSHTATLLDVAPTLAELARLAPDPVWSGTSLLTLDRERPAFAFQLAERNRQAALVDAGHKVILFPTAGHLENGRCEEAFDIAADPREEHNLVRESDWPAELTRRLAPAVLGVLKPLAGSEKAEVPEELRDRLDALGYGGEK